MFEKIYKTQNQSQSSFYLKQSNLLLLYKVSLCTFYYQIPWILEYVLGTSKYFRMPRNVNHEK